MHVLAAVLMGSPIHVSGCWDEAAARYSVNPYLLYAIAKTESGLNPNAINRNKNGSADIGLMQINTAWLPTLRRYGIGANELYNPCTSIYVGAWILAQNQRKLGNTWEAVGAYNAASPDKRIKYAYKVYKNLVVPYSSQQIQNATPLHLRRTTETMVRHIKPVTEGPILVLTD